MNYVFVDFEMSLIGKEYRELRRICRQEIIEIGAVMLDESFSEISSFKRYVRPMYARHISNAIHDLTGIDDCQLYACNEIEEELNAFAHWCLSNGEDVVVYAWSENDLSQIQNEYLLKGLSFSEDLEKVIDSWKDLQAEYDEAVEAAKPTALHRALASIGKSFDGKMHDALDDARNTSFLFVEMSDQEEFLKTVNYTHCYSECEKSTVTLGDLFDFSRFRFDESA
ncbi:MAG: exonuclease domain-containing protein [Clostridiales bacterium]|nr:exonuclease domain-containing protein [Clostridiales bacterium]